MSDQTKLSPQEARQYLAELVAEYLKTMPPPVRVPVMKLVNGCLQRISLEIELRGELVTTLANKEAELASLKKKLTRLEKKKN